MFGTILTVIYTVLILYIIWRATSVPFFSRHISTKAFTGIGFIFWVVFFITQSVGHSGTGPLITSLELIGMLLLGSVFLTSMVLFLADLATGFGFFFKIVTPRLRGYALAIGVLLSVIAIIQGMRPPAVISYDVTLSSLPAELDGKTLVAISDAHIGNLLGEEWFSKRINEIKKLQPDVLVFLGDMFEGHGASPQDIPALRELSVPLGKWFVLGNHEYHQTQGPGGGILENAGFTLLANRSFQIAPGLIMAGVNDLTRQSHIQSNEDLIGQALLSKPKGAVILLSHSPLQTDRASQAGVELMLSGHTHGGQIWPFGYLVQREYPLLAGRYDVNGMTVIVSRGVGTWGPRMRLWKRGEILKITLHAP